MSVESGELRLNVVADTSGLAADLKAKLARVKEDVKVKVKLDTAQIRAELAAATRGVDVKVTPKVDAGELRAALAAATRSVTVSVKPTIDTAALRVALALAVRDVKVNARVDFDRAQVRAAFAAASAGLRVNADVDIDKNKLFRDVRNSIILAMSNLPPIPIPTPGPGGGGGSGALGGSTDSARSLVSVLGQVGKYATIAVGALALFEGAGAAILGVVGGLTAVVNGLFAIASASGAAVGALAAIPAGLSILVSVAATAVAGFKGVGAAVKGLQDSQAAAGKNAQSLAKAQRSAAQTVAAAQKRLQSAYDGVETSARGVTTAQRSIRDAVESVADAQRAARNAVESLTDAQDSLADAQKNVGSVAVAQNRLVAAAEDRVTAAQKARVTAQQRLSSAIEDARQKLEDYDSQLKNAGLSEEGAILAVERARERLNDVSTDPSAKILDRKEADLAYREALQNLQDLQKQNQKLAADAADAAKKGVAGSDEVKDATQAVADATNDVASAQQDQVDALDARTEAERDAAEAVVKAQKDVRDAFEGTQSAADSLRDSFEGVEDAEYSLTQARKNQVKAGQEVADAQQGLRNAYTDAAEAIRDSAGATNEAQKAFLNASPAAQRFATFLVRTFIPVLKRVQGAVQAVLLPDLETALRNLLPLEGPVTGALQAMAGAFGDFAIKASELISSPAWQKDIQKGGDDNARTFSKLSDSVLDLLDTFRNITAAAQPMIDRFTDYLNLVTGGWKETANLNRENGTLEDYFKRTGDVISQWGRILGNVFEGIGNIADAAKPAGQALMDSFEGATENFVKWTEDNASGIEDYFNAIVPTVESVGRILVDVLGKLAEISANPATARIVKLIEDRLGPAIGDLIDALLDSGSGEVFIDLMSDLADILAEIVQSGGLKDVLDFIEGVADKIKNFGGTSTGQKVFHDLIVVAAIGGPLLLVASGAGKLLNALSKITKLPSTGTLLGKLPGLVKSAAKALGKGGLIGLGAGVAGAVAGHFVSDGQGGARDVAGGALSGAGTGAAIGATVGSVVPGLGTGVGAAVGAGIGGIAGAIKGNGGIKKTFDDLQAALQKGYDNLESFARDHGVDLGNLLRNPFDELPNVARAVAEGLPGLISKILDGGTRLFNWIGDEAQKAARGAVNFLANMPLLIIEGITAVVRAAPGAFDWVLDQATKVIQKVVDAFGFFIEHPVESFKNIGEFLYNVGDALFSGIDDLVGAANSIGIKILIGILEGLGDVYEKMKPALGELGRALKDSGDQIFARWQQFWQDLVNIVAKKFGEIVIGAAQSGSDLFAKIQSALRGIGDLWTKFWQGLKDWATQKIVEATGGIFNTLGDFYRNITSTLGGIGDVWNKFWDGLKAAAANPVKFVIDTVINGGIGGAWKAVDSFLGDILPNWNDVKYSGFATGGVLPGYTPGRDVHMYSSPTGGRLALSGGEAIMRPEWTRAVGGERGVEAMNRAARTGGTSAVQSMLGGFANGGVLQSFANGGVNAVIAFGKYLRTQGYSVGENKALGDNPRKGVHSASGYHYRDDNSGAIDVNKGAGKSLAEQIELAKAVNSARTRGLRTYFFASDGTHQDHAHFDYGSGDNVQTGKMPAEVRAALTSSTGGVGGALSGLWDDIKGTAADAASALVKAAGNLPIVSTITNMASALGSVDGVNLKSAGIGAATSLVGSVKNFLSDKVGGFLGSGESSEIGLGGSDSSYDLSGSDLASSDRGTVGKGVERWRTTALRALEITKSPAAWVTSLLRRMMQESSGNQYAINNTDSNAKKGTPSKGLMQVIDPTFRSNALPGYDKNIYDPLSNIIASIRYADAKYGTAPKGWDRKGGYSLGGVLPDIPRLADGGTIMPKTGGTLALLAERGKPESVVDSGRLNELLAKLSTEPNGVVFADGAIKVYNPVPETASTSISDRLRTVAAFGLFDQS